MLGLGVKGRVINRVCVSLRAMVVATVISNPNLNPNRNQVNRIPENIPCSEFEI